MTRKDGRLRRRGAVLDSLETRRLPAAPTPVVALVEFAPNSSKTVPETAGKLNFTVTRTGDLSIQTSVRVRTVQGTALDGYDYTPFQAVLTFAPGQTTATFSVNIVDDKVSEAAFKSFTVVLSEPSAGGGLAQGSTATVFIMDDEAASQQPLSVFDYGAYGTWVYDHVDGFRKIDDADPQAVVGSSNRSAYLDLGPDGLWAWDSQRGLRKLSAADPQQVIVINDDATRAEDVVLVDMGAGGFWRYSDSQGWRQLSGVDPKSIVIDRQTRTAYVDFGYGGLWRWSDATPWLKLNDTAPEGMAADRGVLFTDYGPSGTWSWSVAQGWRKIGDGDPQAIVSQGSSLYADYGAAGLWAWTDAGGWSQLNAADPRSMKVVAGVLYLDFAGSGLWSWTSAAKFKQVTTTEIQGLLYAPAAGRLFVDQGASGLWGWTANGFKQLNPADPDSAGSTA